MRITQEQLEELASGGRIWTVTLLTEQRLVATVIAGNDTDKNTLRELALMQADEGRVAWETTSAVTKVKWL